MEEDTTFGLYLSHPFALDSPRDSRPPMAGVAVLKPTGCTSRSIGGGCSDIHYGVDLGSAEILHLTALRNAD
jgi:hypothetical protein